MLCLKKYYQCFWILVIISAGLLSGCAAVGPDYKPPQTRLSPSYAGAAASQSSEQHAVPTPDISKWWDILKDPELSSLIQRAIASNLDVKLAESHIRQARAGILTAQSSEGPKLNAGSSLNRSRTPGNAERNTLAIISNQFRAGFDASWEFDIFGGTRRGIEASEADLQASIEGYHNVWITLTSEVAKNYIELRSFQQRIIIAKNNLAAQKHSAQLTKKRFSAGFISALDVSNANAQVATTAAQIPSLETSATQVIYSLSILLGQEPGDLLEELSPSADFPSASSLIPVGVPSDLLRRRPDIRKAEAGIHADTARIGVATADLFPKFTIAGSSGFQSGQINTWLERLSHFWSFGPSISWPVFDSGRVRANIETKKAISEQSIITYKKTVLNALQEVENALVEAVKGKEHQQSLIEAVAANRKAVDLSLQIYTMGQTDFLNVLQAQRSLYASEDALAISNRDLSTNLVALYKALGGGWEATVPDVTN